MVKNPIRALPGVQPSPGRKTPGGGGGQNDAIPNISQAIKMKHPKKTQEKEKKGPALKDIVTNITIEEILQKAGETDVGAVEAINLHACGITKIVHMERFQNLRSLDLSCNAITQIENLTNSSMTDLKLYGNMITTVNGLGLLNNLETLSLQHNRIRSISNGFSEQRKMRSLRLDSNQLATIEPRDLNCCRNLESIDLSYNLLESLSALRFASNLWDLSAVGNKLTQVDCTGNTALTEVDISFNHISDVSGIAHLVNLQVLKLTSNDVASLQPMGQLRKLIELHIASNRLTNLHYIRKQFPNLEYLDVSDNLIDQWKNVEYLKFCPSIRELYIKGNACITDDEDESPGNISKILPNLKVFNGRFLETRLEKSAMLSKRAASASTAITVRQVQNELDSLSVNLDENETNIMRTFESIRDLMKSLPLHPPKDTPPAMPTTPLSTSRVSSRARLEDAKLFASMHPE